MTGVNGGPEYGRQLAERRTEVGMTPAELAQAVGATVERIEAIEAGAKLDAGMSVALWVVIEDRRAARQEQAR